MGHPDDVISSVRPVEQVGQPLDSQAGGLSPNVDDGECIAAINIHSVDGQFCDVTPEDKSPVEINIDCHRLR